MRTALTQIKEELGPDAVIMSNKKIPEGVELMAAVDYGQAVAQPEQATSAKQQESTAAQTKPQQIMADDTVNLSSQPQATMKSKTPKTDTLQALLDRKVQMQNQQQAASTQAATETKKYTGNNPQVGGQLSGQTPTNSIEEQFKSFTERLAQSAQDSDNEHLDNSQSQLTNDESIGEIKNTVSSSATVNMGDFNKMKEEMASIRQLLEHQVSGLMWQDMAQRDPSRALLTNKLMEIGISEQIADQVAGYVPAQASEAQALQHALSLLSQQLNTTQNDIIKRGGVISLVGPTGVGKTTTVAKLAAKFAQLHGAEHVALISTDTYRIGGFQQLETYGKIIGCQVKLAKDASSLEQILSAFSNKKLVLIDTAGMGQRDLRLAEHLSSLVSNSRVRIRNYLVLSANTQANVMQENVERFKKIPLCGCIYTKLDESLSIGEIISTSIQNGLPIGYLTDGQRVPEDIKVANAGKLVSLAEKMASKSLIKNSMNSRMVLKSAPAIS